MSESTCRSCGAPIIWAITKTGRKIPLDAEPFEGGRVWAAQTERGFTAFFPPDGQEVEGCVEYRSHFTSCPHAKKHRKRPQQAEAAGTLTLTCRRCVKDVAPQLRWVTHGNGIRAIEARCPHCRGWLKWLEQTPENIARTITDDLPPSGQPGLFGGES